LIGIACPAVSGGSYTTAYSALLSDATGVIPNAYGQLSAKVGSDLRLSPSKPRRDTRKVLSLLPRTRGGGWFLSSRVDKHARFRTSRTDRSEPCGALALGGRSTRIKKSQKGRQLRMLVSRTQPARCLFIADFRPRPAIRASLPHNSPSPRALPSPAARSRASSLPLRTRGPEAQRHPSAA
jgi:hypothetical protein